MKQAAMELTTRVEKALGQHDVAHELRDSILDGIYESGGLGRIGWDEVDQPTQALIQQAEALPQTGWDDPADVPDDADTDA